MFNSIEEYNSFAEGYKLNTKKELSMLFAEFRHENDTQLIERVISFYNHKTNEGRGRYYIKTGIAAFLVINNAAFHEFIESMETSDLKRRLIIYYDNNLMRRFIDIDKEICLRPINLS